jgi:hypothetical protein
MLGSDPHPTLAGRLLETLHHLLEEAHPASRYNKLSPCYGLELVEQ